MRGGMGGHVHNPRVCFAFFLISPKLFHQEPLLLMCWLTPRKSQTRRRPSTRVTHWPVMSKQRYFILLLRRGRRVVSHFWLTDTERRAGCSQQFVKFFSHAKSKIWAWIELHCWAAELLIPRCSSSGFSGPIEKKKRESKEETLTQRRCGEASGGNEAWQQQSYLVLAGLLLRRLEAASVLHPGSGSSC